MPNETHYGGWKGHLGCARLSSERGILTQPPVCDTLDTRAEPDLTQERRPMPNENFMEVRRLVGDPVALAAELNASLNMDFFMISVGQLGEIGEVAAESLDFHGCGTIACIAGTATLVQARGKKSRKFLHKFLGLDGGRYQELCHSFKWAKYDKVTPEMAVAAMDRAADPNVPINEIWEDPGTPSREGSTN
jgi:hypothetical protein